MDEVKNICSDCGSRYNAKLEIYSSDGVTLFTAKQPSAGFIELRACASCGTVFLSDSDRKRILKQFIPEDAFKED